MRVCYFGTYRKNYSRNRIMIDGLKTTGIDVIECHETLWFDIDDRIQIFSGGWKNPSFWLRVIKTYSRLIYKYFKIKNYDIMIVGYPGHFDVLIARILTWVKKKPLVWDVLMSLYLISHERNLTAKNTFITNIIRKVEKIACILPDQLIIESTQYADWFKSQYSVPLSKFWIIPLGANDQKFYLQKTSVNNSKYFSVLYYGSFIPNHGISVMLDAAKNLQFDQNIRFVFVGEGPELEKIKNEIENYPNITFLGYLPFNELLQVISNCDLCLGVFGDTDQSKMTIQNKIFENLAMSKPIISGKSDLIDEYFIHKHHLYICERNSDSLVTGILELKNDPKLRKFIANNGHKLFTEKYSYKIIGRKLADHLLNLKTYNINISKAEID